MIGWLSGNIRDIQSDGHIVVETHGVGYDVVVSLQTLCNLHMGKNAELHIHTHVREDQFILFGFSTTDEREMFRKLNTVSGIGARMALNLMSGMSCIELAAAIEQADDLAIARTPGIGKKIAQRLILELQGKLQLDTPVSAGDGNLRDVRSALVNLGYKPPQIDKALKQVQPSQDFEDAFKQALKALN
ncbi:MAG: Holliday junction branch migration protein RuvA [Zetaproteobacteria bacterium CG_4_9_14_3_um_filter_49_83]|nr:MAG: Holliday junction DNA helicase RuvA [Zetaproteobacteria bacterium CG1_02_49_23]PIQ30730.1 MAG: Holliday junction branch migration protein RuvA [Zetaproteobacteria bacterium CG17_big_fil_post_rev_8_21_14_2_50_50_13]PIY56853.1 MAG: Holliday junction branch migration protein RuvA [Zetaproteobacteria bacterium CG_4_10_14_0_8_um_filter_49_80]PJA35137.1 MAG: Holliday junction branch migration protein RuvA [Zetaproteobacteria bacterium CG_4_9_14_3_um_filter_49_83]